MLSSLINKFVRLCELRHGLSTCATRANTNLKEKQQQRELINKGNGYAIEILFVFFFRVFQLLLVERIES